MTLVTASEVARVAGVSRSAVSRAFTPGASVSAKARDRIERAADALGYRPNQIARSLITGRSGIVGIVVGYMENQFYPALIESLAKQLGAAGKRLLIFPLAQHHDRDVQIEELLHYHVDALILTSAVISSDIAARCRGRGVPIILINRRTLDDSCHSVTGDNEAGADAIGMLVAGQYRRPAYMAGLEDSSTSREREAGFRAALARAELAISARVVGNYEFALAQQAARELLVRADRPDVIFCANDHMALAAHGVMTSEFGLTVGRDIGLIGFDDVVMAAWPSFALTTYSQPVDEMAHAAVDLVINATSAESRHVRIPGKLIQRASTAG